MQIGTVVTLRSTLNVEIVGEMEVAEHGRKVHYLVGRLATPAYIYGVMSSYILFRPKDIQS